MSDVVPRRRDSVAASPLAPRHDNVEGVHRQQPLEPSARVLYLAMTDKQNGSWPMSLPAVSAPRSASRGDAAFIVRLREAADNSGMVTFAEFMRNALYDPEVGYYTAQRKRVGRGGDTDFYTSSSMGAVFGPAI